MLRFASTLLVAGALAAPPLAMAQTTFTDLPPELRIYIERYPTQALSRLTQALANVHPNARATREQIETYLLSRSAEIRARHLGRLMVVDLDANNAISPDEIETVIPTRGISEGSMRAIMQQTDVDGDGTATQAEIEVFIAERVDAEVNDARLPSGEWARFLMIFDLNADDLVDSAELAQFFADLPNTEVPATNSPSGQPTLRPDVSSSQSCHLPAPSSSAQVVVIGGYEGAAISSVSLGDREDITTVITLEITSGDEPIYLAVSNLRPTVWRLTGATQRIEQLVSLSGSRPSGFTGIDEARIAFQGDTQCSLRYFTDSQGAHAAQARGRLTGWLGQSVDHLYGSYDLGQLVLGDDGVTETGAIGRPSGDVVIISGGAEFEVSADGIRRIADDGDLQSLTNSIRRHFPLGIIRKLDPSAVVTAGAPAQRYEVLPVQAGLLDLMISGAISRTSDGYYSIDHPIARFPPGLNGGFLERFVVRTGVPFPAGSPGHSTVIIEKTGECIGIGCR